MAHIPEGFVKLMRRHPVLDSGEERALALAARAGDRDAADRLVASNVRLVVKLAREICPDTIDLADMIQEGNVGLVEAVARFDPHRGVRFATFAAIWIRAMMYRHLLDNLRSVKLGTSHARRRLFFNLRKEQERLRRAGAELEADLAIVADALGMPEEEVRAMDAQLGSSDVPLDAPEVGTVTRLERLQAQDAPPDETAARHELRTKVSRESREFAARLRGREQTIYCRRWLDDEPPTLAGLAAELGISRERSRQLERRILDRLARRLERRLGSSVRAA